jgi:hypothetical protein
MTKFFVLHCVKTARLFRKIGIGCYEKLVNVIIGDTSVFVLIYVQRCSAGKVIE